jgi:sigma-B regulation protein RsbU (phosphoserine phosphatase)
MIDEPQLPIATINQYEGLLRRCTASLDEAMLHEAHEFGREMLDRGHGVLDIVALHGRLVAKQASLQPAESLAQFADAASRLLVEALTPFEMTHRGFRAVNTAIQAGEQRSRTPTTRSSPPTWKAVSPRSIARARS